VRVLGDKHLQLGVIVAGPVVHETGTVILATGVGIGVTRAGVTQPAFQLPIAGVIVLRFVAPVQAIQQAAGGTQMILQVSLATRGSIGLQMLIQSSAIQEFRRAVTQHTQAIVKVSFQGTALSITRAAPLGVIAKARAQAGRFELGQLVLRVPAELSFELSAFEKQIPTYDKIKHNKQTQTKPS
jgi:phosphotransferase system  glucose/maltose/N-acetylglucosamine-specific IIC component